VVFSLVYVCISVSMYVCAYLLSFAVRLNWFMGSD